MAMAMGVASLAVTAPKQQLVTPRAAANRGEKQGFLDWFRTALDKDSLSETDAVLDKVDGVPKGSNGRGAVPAKKGATAPPKKAGFNFFGKK